MIYCCKVEHHPGHCCLARAEQDFRAGAELGHARLTTLPAFGLDHIRPKTHRAQRHSALLFLLDGLATRPVSIFDVAWLGPSALRRTLDRQTGVHSLSSRMSYGGYSGNIRDRGGGNTVDPLADANDEDISAMRAKVQERVHVAA